MREENWMLSSELFDPSRKEPEEVIAFRILQEEDWVHFVMNIEGNDALKFFNPEQREFSCADTWAKLAEMEGVECFDNRFRIDSGMAEKAKDFCREFRTALRTHDLLQDLPPGPMFVPPWAWKWPLDEENLVVLVCPDEVLEDLPVHLGDMAAVRGLYPYKMSTGEYIIGY